VRVAAYIRAVTESTSTRRPDAVDVGRDALTRGDWVQARQAFSDALAEEETAEALEGLGWVYYWLDDAPASMEARQAAYRLYRRGGDLLAAARVAVRLSEDYFTYRGDMAVANGWLRRAESLLAGHENTTEYGWWLLTAGHYRLRRDDDADGGRRCAQTAAMLGRLHADPDLEAVGLSLEGLALVEQGDMAEGMSRLDEATAAASSGELTSFDAVMQIYCYLILACHLVRDYERAAEWCRTAKAIAERYGMRQCFSVCRTWYAGVLVWHGAWEEAEAELMAATRYLGESRPPMARSGIVRLGELRVRQGRLDDAEALFAQCEGAPAALLGRAAIASERGDPGGAAALAERYLRGMSDANRVDRVPGLELLARVRAVLGDVEAARDAAAELAEIAQAVGTTPLRASACEARAHVAFASHDPEVARQALEDAVDLYERSGSPFHAARARLELARALMASGSRGAAAEEACRARDALAAIGAGADTARAEALLQEAGRTPGREPTLLTPREVEVLGFVADGLNDREIAARLVLSEHTVHRHVANILAKLRVSSRASAAAQAAKLGLI
jgi:ATP/maltotriose-dependent transcriptional regulator MalT